MPPFSFVLRYMVKQSVICANENKSGRPRLREGHLYIFPDGVKSIFFCTKLVHLEGDVGV
jgi:hypothetical protein